VAIVALDLKLREDSAKDQYPGDGSRQHDSASRFNQSIAIRSQMKFERNVKKRLDFPGFFCREYARKYSVIYVYNHIYLYLTKLV
jgi:hypothetical protein